MDYLNGEKGQAGLPEQEAGAGRLSHLFVNIKDLVEAMEGVDDNWYAYLNVITGNIVCVSSEYRYLAETMELDEIRSHYTKWEQGLILEALDVMENPEDYISLPTQRDVNECGIMRAFIEERCNPRQQEVLGRAISGRHAFHRFKDALYDLGIERKWFSYRDQAMYHIAREWCKIHGIRYEDAVIR